MKAPEKLYLSKNIYNTYLYQVPDPDDDTAIEYIRKDAFIEKAITYLILNTRTVHYSFGDKRELSNPNLEVVIEDFKKYMED